MSYSFEYIDIILLAMIAGFIFLRLRGILGKRTGFEGKVPSQFEQVLNPESKLNKAESFDDKVESFDDKIKKVLQKDLATDSDLETSLNYSQEDNDNKYQEIFSNSIVSAKNPSKDDSRNLKDKKKFFNNYLAF